MSKKLFEDLHNLAGDRRDQVINAARKSYGREIQEIAAMEHWLLGKPKAKRPKNARDEKLVDLIASVIPSDRGVSIDDVCGLLRGADPDRKFGRATVRTILNRLKHEDTIKQISKAQADKPVLYALPGFDSPEMRSLSEWAAIVLKSQGKPMKAVEIMVSMTEMGYEMDVEPATAVQELVRSLQKNSSFRQSGLEWLFCRPNNELH